MDAATLNGHLEKHLRVSTFPLGIKSYKPGEALPAAGVAPSDALGTKIVEAAREATRLRGEVVFATGTELPDKDKTIVDKRKWD